MNVYDTLNKLAEELKNSEEYKNLKTAKQTIELNQENKTKISEFEKMRYEEQINSIQTGRKDEQKIKELQEVYKNLIEIEEIKKYFDAELKFNILLGDINKTITETVKDVLS